eukprot:TRINITY_DN67559_c6_g2_i1.p1 TRINITY_DN67559_c6_g2~~TRINITY_DN67559_c6_g2_i1.p1  ORF type:complete len:361 (+),score=12.74 TRINITY_DN67559_c6_g2_i1:15-1097(+)
MGRRSYSSSRSRSRSRSSRSLSPRRRRDSSSRSRSPPPRREAQATNETLYICDYPMDWREDDLRDLVEPSGNVDKLVMKDSFAFVTMETLKGATRALNDLNGKVVEGKRMKVECARRSGPPKRDREEPSDTLFVVNFAPGTDKRDIEDFFDGFEVDEVSIAGKNYAFVRFCDVREAEDALEAKKDTMMGDKRISLEFKHGRQRGGGGGGGGGYGRGPPRGRDGPPGGYGGGPWGGGGGRGYGAPPPGMPPWMMQMGMMGMHGMGGSDWMGGGGYGGGRYGGGSYDRYPSSRRRDQPRDDRPRERNNPPARRLSSREREDDAAQRWGAAPTRPDGKRDRSRSRSPDRRRRRHNSRSRSTSR